MAETIARGAPIGPPRGIHVEPEGVRYGPLTPPQAGVPLTVLTGVFDDHRRFVGPGDSLYASATYAHNYREYWTDSEHRDYWRAHLHLWPAKRGRSSNRESLAFAIVSAEALGMPSDELSAAIGYTHDDLRDRRVLKLAERMRSELEAGPSGIRVPRVVTNEELGQLPLLTTRQTLDIRETAANAKMGLLAQQAVLRGAAAAGAWRRRADEERRPALSPEEQHFESLLEQLNERLRSRDDGPRS